MVVADVVIFVSNVVADVVEREDMSVVRMIYLFDMNL